MQKTDPMTAWKAYKAKELPRIKETLLRHGYRLDDEQPHTEGERFLMQAVTTKSGRKLILLGHRQGDDNRVVIKATSDKKGRNELEHERKCRELLHKINFAYDIFHSPKEIEYINEDGILITIQAFIDQPEPFLNRSTPEQFDFALKALKAQESVRATTHGHLKTIESVFGSRQAGDYVSAFTDFRQGIVKALPKKAGLHELLLKTETELRNNLYTIEQYGGFLTHTDFVPHNFRIKDNVIYLLDYSSLRFGNKHEGWARFLNFMALYNPELQKALEQYIKDNRAPEELESLRLMRLYRLGEIIFYYAKTLSQIDGDLHSLNEARVDFWSAVLFAVIEGDEVPESTRQEYIRRRDELRSNEEKLRQKNLH